MILETLTLSNFGMFAGTQHLNLKPLERRGKVAPIVLFGGLNGSGKTTILDAIQLALYGGRAQCSKRAGLSYDSFLRHSLHNGTTPSSSAGVRLKFQYAENGVNCVYEVSRSWESAGDAVRESLAVTKNGQNDTWLSENWNQIVDDLIPFGLSQLFFFDGEKIKALAEESTANEVLETSIKSLLGLDIIERLLADTTIVQTKLLKRSASAESSQGALAELEGDYRRACDELSALKAERASLENDRLRAEESLKQAEEEFRSRGGDYWSARESMARDLATLESRRQHLRQELLALAGGELPLALVRPLLKQVSQRAHVEAEQLSRKLLLNALVDRDRAVIKALKSNGAKDAATFLEQWLRKDRDSRITAETVDGASSAKLSESMISRLRGLLERQLKAVATDAKQSSDELATVAEQIESKTRSQAAIPDERTIAPLAERFKAAASELAALCEKAKRLDDDIAAKGNFVTRSEQALRNRLDVHVKEQFQNEDALRLAGIAGRARDVLQKFLVKATERKIERLSVTITDSFRFLVRKQSLVHQINIDSSTFEIELQDAEGRVVPKHRLSEGEKQIFAIAVLWGLGKCSPRPLPAVIDTPMARLDTTHRGHLVDRYFPNASHQVIILSTDTEVDEDHYRSLQPFIARGYFLNYDERARATTAEEGYFWKGAGELLEAMR